MPEHELKDSNPEQEPHDLSETAIEQALDGFAADSDTWITAKQVFEDAKRRKLPLDVALDAALERANLNNDAESAPNEARLRFWNNMDPAAKEGETPTPAIDRALDGFAPDGDTWIQGREAFERAMENKGTTIRDALHAALKAAGGKNPESTAEEAEDRFYGHEYDAASDPQLFNGRRGGIRTPNRVVGIGRRVTRRPSREPESYAGHRHGAKLGGGVIAIGFGPKVDSNKQ
jgi:hypothetical protein